MARLSQVQMARSTEAVNRHIGVARRALYRLSKQALDPYFVAELANAAVLANLNML